MSIALNQSELAILHHPDQKTSWTVVATCYLDSSLTGTGAARVCQMIESRLDTLSQSLPTVSSRIEGTFWIPASPPVVEVATSDDRTPPSMLRRFDLANEPALRILVGPDGHWVSFFVHHCALDGARLIVAMKLLLCGVIPATSPPPSPAKAQFPWAALKRVLLPANPVARSSQRPDFDSFVARNLPIIGAGITSFLPMACLAASCEFSKTRGKPCKRVGLSLGIALDGGAENRSTYRRIDSRASRNISEKIQRALSTPAEPWEIRHTSRYLKFLGVLAERASDTVLLTNLGRQVMPGVTRMEGYPVARGRSGVSFAAVRLAGGDSTLTLRTRDINMSDANWIIDRTIELLTQG